MIENCLICMYIRARVLSIAGKSFFWPRPPVTRPSAGAPRVPVPPRRLRSALRFSVTRAITGFALSFAIIFLTLPVVYVTIGGGLGARAAFATGRRVPLRELSSVKNPSRSSHRPPARRPAGRYRPGGNHRARQS